MKNDTLSYDGVYNLAYIAHLGQTRRDGKTAYIEHIKSVIARTSAITNGDTKAMQVAALHDVLEDTDITEARLVKLNVDVDVIEAVKLLTKPKNANYINYIKYLKESGNTLALTVKRADILSNLSDDPTDRQIIKYANALLELMK